MTPPETGEYTLALTGDDGYRLILNNETVIENWSQHASETRRTQIELQKGTPVDLVIEYFQGPGGADIRFEWSLPNEDAFQKAVDLAAESDVVIFTGGISPTLEGEEMNVDYEGFEGGDRTKIQLPEVQRDLLKKLKATNTPIVLVLCSGSALAVNWAEANAQAILQVWYPGQAGGDALADVLFGDVSPSGKLPVTFYKSVEQLPPFTDYVMKNRTYKYFTGDPLYPFGYGLSYTTFEYSDLLLSEKVSQNDSVKVSFKLKNTGNYAGAEVAQVYVRDMEAFVERPLKALKGFEKVLLEPGHSQTVNLSLSPEALAYYDSDAGEWRTAPGEFEILVGSSSNDIRLQGIVTLK